jgi:hypothetical protein
VFICVHLWLPLLLILGCRQDMHDQPKYKDYRLSTFFADQRDMRPALPGTVARGQLDADTALFSGKVGDHFSDSLPMPLNRALLERGEDRYNIYCTPCHDRAGTGEGMIVQRGYRHPVSFHDERLRHAPVGYFFDVATNGFGVMPAYAAQAPTVDRWAIAAYIRALQLSQNATLADVPEPQRASLDAGNKQE